MCWYHEGCLGAQGHQLNGEKASQNLTKARLELADHLMEEEQESLALAAIMRGKAAGDGTCPHGVAGYIAAIMDTFEGRTGWEEGSYISTSWDDTPMYACPRCPDGFM